MLLTSLPCSMSLKRTDRVFFYDLIAHARHFMNNCMRNSVQFWLSCQVAVSVLGLLSLLLLLPPLFTLGDAMWLSCFVIPILALTISFATMDRVEAGVMEIASTKNQVTVDRSVSHPVQGPPANANTLCIFVSRSSSTPSTSTG